MQFRKNYQQPVFEHGKFLIIDSHGGAEDIVGLVAAIKLAKNTGKTILGITVTNGRRDLEHATKDVMLACKMCKQSIPIYQGIHRLTQGQSRAYC